MKHARLLHRLVANKERLAVLAAALGLPCLYQADLIAWARRKSDASEFETRSRVLEADIQRARDLARALVPATRTNHELIAQASLDIEDLDGEIGRAQAELDVLRRDVQTRRDELAGKQHDGKGVKPGDLAARRELRHVFSDYLSRESSLEARRQLLRNRQSDLAKARAAQIAALQKSRALNAAIAGYESRIKRLRCRDGVGGKPVELIEGQKFGELEGLLRDIRNRLVVAEHFSDLSGESATASLDDEFSEQIIEREIDRHFSRNSSGGSHGISARAERRAP
jgi:hypothetical protein